MGLFNATIKVGAKTIAPGASSDSSYTENVFILPANAYVIAMFGRVRTAFAGLTKPKVSLGVTGDTTRYCVAQPIDAVNEIMIGKIAKSSSGINRSPVEVPDRWKKDWAPSPGFCERMPKEKIQATATPIIATFTSSSTDFSGLTAGEVEFVIVYVDTNSY